MASPGITPDGHLIPKHVAVVDHSSKISEVDIAFHVEALAIQMREHIAPLWDEEPPGIAFYGKADKIPPDQAAVLAYVDSDGNADSAGYHAEIAGLVYGLIDVGQSRIPERTASHEFGEMYANCRLTRKVMGPKNRLYYVEIMDPTQEQTYEIEVTLFGETRKIKVSDFVTPRWYGIKNTDPADPRMTYLGQPLRPFEAAPGGYQIAEEQDGEVVFLSAGAARMNRSSHSRTRKIINQKFPRV